MASQVLVRESSTKINSRSESVNFYIETYGCQMNFSDSYELGFELSRANFIENKEFSDHTNVVLLNTCSVRESAEERVFGRLGYYKSVKQQRPLVVVVMGCMAQAQQHKILERAPYVDIISGTYGRKDLAGQIETAFQEQLSKHKPLKIIYSQQDDYQFLDAVPDHKAPFKSYINIIHGCNKFCTFCIVPFTRGKEISRSSKDVIDNVKRLIDLGVIEVTLVGQNVNSYNRNTNDLNLGELLIELNKLKGLERIRYLTNHPRDFTIELVDQIASSEKVCPDIALPLQSGSNRILKEMRRGYTYELYLEKVAYIREKIQPVSIYTDIIVGYPGETDDDYQDTLNAINEIGFDYAFMFKYNQRPYSKASEFEDSVPEEVKSERLAYLIDLQRSLAAKKAVQFVGKDTNVLVEGISKNSIEELVGTTVFNQKIIFPANSNLIGTIQPVKITEYNGQTFKGEVLKSS